MTKYIGPKTDGENVATQADKLSLSSETPDALTPDQTGAAGTATTAARSDHQHEILAASAGTITGTNAEGTSTSFARADHDHAYGSLSIPNSALALGPTYETSLPGSPVDGQEIYYAADATNSIIWHLRYRSAARSNNGAWEFVGGSSLSNNVETFESTATTHSTYQDLTTVGPQITVPLKGDYLVTAMADTRRAATSDFAMVAVKIGTAATSDNNTLIVNSTGQPNSSTGHKVVSVSATSTVLKLQYRSFSNNQSSYQLRRLLVRPVFVYA